MNKLVIVIFLAGIAQFPGTDGLSESATYSVNLEYFSGRPSPSWKIKPTDDNYVDISQMFMSAKKGQQLFLIDNIPAQLGYRGFLVCDGSSEWLVLGKATTELQKRLLESAPKGQLSDKIIKQVTAAIERGVEPTKTRQRRATSYPPDNAWRDMRVKDCNNCYNYGVDKILPVHTSFGVPGLGFGQPYWNPGNQLTAASVRDAAVRDKLIVTPAGPGNAIPHIPQATRHLVALVVDPDTAPGADDGDFHWYRLDSNNRWSHKPGSTAVTNKDGAGAIINDPRTAANSPGGPNYLFVCFMTVVKNVVTVKGYDDNKC